MSPGSTGEGGTKAEDAAEADEAEADPSRPLSVEAETADVAVVATAELAPPLVEGGGAAAAATKVACDSSKVDCAVERSSRSLTPAWQHLK